ncbi:MAG: PhnD/SsuA/transferrin family substrate-binding protein [Antarcticimicrobium sp.]|uniref:PhnD/SsuA/transferrin family substrate-binding protein n=1 Tax=Antarcticimicrobium sp. TaxID=2824147 RepID=UPI002614FED5|nr:PhnD/SsuA/transferrin family substrate-binding protein [Antarcticimicrobium sp.]MDF1717395.1 PhnD/SsuA/transferrin family substrate-binding protein [Antarcticimicrobium sp.]
MRRRQVIAAFAASAALSAPPILRAQTRFRLALTPVFLDNDARVIEQLRAALSEGTGQDIDLVQRRTYQEITGALLDGSVDAAWVCGYPFLQHKDQLSLLGVPVWRGRPLYRSYLIVSAGDAAERIEDLRGGMHAFSDPDSNSGFLVTASDLARMGETPDGFFSRTLFTWGHRNVVRAVAGGLVRSGSVDGYVWEALSVVEPDLVPRTRVIARSELLGFPPFAARTDRIGDADVAALQRALLGMNGTATGRAALDLLFLDRIAAPDLRLFDGIALRMAELGQDG